MTGCHDDRGVAADPGDVVWRHQQESPWAGWLRQGIRIVHRNTKKWRKQGEDTMGTCHITWQLQIPAISLKKTNNIGNYRFLLYYSVNRFRKSKQLGFICLSVWKFERILMLFKWRVTLLSNRKCSCSSFNHSRKIYQLPSWLISW